VISAANGIEYAYRQVGEGTPALVLLQHFRGNLDNWDPALVDALAHNRRVVTFDTAGVGGSTGKTPSTITQMARDAIAFLEALELDAVDLLGFSIGSFVAQEIAPDETGGGPSPGPRLSSPARRRRDARLGTRGDRSRGRARAQPRRVPRRLLHALGREPASGRGDLGAADRPARRSGRALDLADPAGPIDAVCEWGIPDHGELQRVSAIDMPVFVANGDSDPMILPHFSYLLAGLLPQARVKIYPDAAHGFLFQHHAEFARDVDAFLRE
jgi:pimeloyl-ACP methyl ester carboxylesterase